MRFQLKLSFFIAAFALFIISCDNEPLDPALNIDDFNTSNNIAGTFRLTAFNTSIPTDLNNDGVSSTNQMAEVTCYNNSLLILNSDNTFIANSKGVDIVTDGTTLTLNCFVDPDITGTWSATNNVLSLSYTESGTNVTEQFSINGNVLTKTIQNGEIVGTTSTNQPVYLTSNITIIYTKQ